jgi:hypothetical protein
LIPCVTVAADIFQTPPSIFLSLFPHYDDTFRR